LFILPFPFSFSNITLSNFCLFGMTVWEIRMKFREIFLFSFVLIYVSCLSAFGLTNVLPLWPPNYVSLPQLHGETASFFCHNGHSGGPRACDNWELSFWNLNEAENDFHGVSHNVNIFVYKNTCF
jgi:hypothetical protein